MAELLPLPLNVHLARIFREFHKHDAVYDIPVKKLYRPGMDLSVNFHSMSAATPLGPAAGPQDQLSRNIVMSYLDGRNYHAFRTLFDGIIEDKTVNYLNSMLSTQEMKS